MRQPELVHELLERSAVRTPDQPFLIQDGSVTTYGEVESHANQLARVLIGQGLSPGDRVALLAQNSAFYVEAYFAIQKAGGIVVPLNTATNARSAAEILDVCRARMLLVDQRHQKTAVEAASCCRSVFFLGIGGDLPDPETGSGTVCLDVISARDIESKSPVQIERDEKDCTNIIFTSGSTGKPRGAMLSHLNIVSNAISIVDYLRLGPDDRVLQVLPFFYVYGQSLLTTHALVGGTIVIENRFMYPKVALDTLEETRCTGFSGVPSSFAILLDRSDFAERELPALRYVTAAGGAMNSALTRRLMAAMPERQIFIMYGATEASARLSYLPPRDLPGKPNSIGKAIPGVELSVVTAEGREAEAGEEGEIVARGSNIMSGYWEDEEATAEVLNGKALSTGDLAYRDEDGFLYVVGRKRDFIKAGANRVSAREVEEVIAEIPDIHEVAVVGVADDVLGERICAFVVLREGSEVSVGMLTKSLRSKLPPYKMPSQIFIRDDLPMNESGKIDKRRLARFVANEKEHRDVRDG
ncbi:MAG: class I adenylate-forming enzyme family protein [Gammaproteobacteria bacterium]